MSEKSKCPHEECQCRCPKCGMCYYADSRGNLNSGNYHAKGCKSGK